MFNFQHLALFTIVLWSLAAGAESAPCENVRLDQNGGPFEKIPVYDQRKYSKTDSAICYAVSAAELVDAHRFYAGDKELKKLTAPLSIAINYKNHPDAVLKTGVGIGDAGLAIQASRDRKVCDQRELEKFSSLTRAEKVTSARQRIFRNSENDVDGFMSSILNEIEAHRKTRSGLERGETRSCSPATDLFRSRVAKGQLDFSSLNEATLAAVDQEKPMARAQAFMDEFCKDKDHVLSIPKPESFQPKKSAHLELMKAFEADDKEAMKRALDQMPAENAAAAKQNFEKVQELLCGPKPVPIAVDINDAILHGRDDGLGRHVAVIIGQRCKENSCEMLVRDSYGPCNGANGKSRYSYECTNGSVWVPAEKLMQNTFGMDWIPRD